MTPDLGHVVEKLRRSTVAIAVSLRGAGGAEAGGSGVVIDANGGIVTNAHVAAGPRATVEMWDGRRFEASVLRRDEGRDLALLGVRATGLPAAELGDSGRLRAGEIAVAVGSPLGFRGAMSAGVFHADGNPPGPGGRRWVEAALRLAPGNSGGPLADSAGRVVGINTMIAGGLAFAVPSDSVRRFLARPRSGPALGVTLRPLVFREGARRRFGLQVVEIASGSPAEEASLRGGDVLTGADGRDFAALDDLQDVLSEWSGAMRLQFRRDDLARPRTVTVVPHSVRAEAA